MDSPSHNHVNFQPRLDYIRRLLGDNYGLSDKELSETSITPIAYEPDFPFKYNNFVYRLSIAADISNTPQNVDGAPALEQPKPAQAGCVPIPAGTKEFIIRLSNSEAEGMHQETRVQNEVAILTLASAALEHIEQNIVPRVFGWGAASPGRLGWIIQELMLGVPLDDVFSPDGSLDRKKRILGQMASILKGLLDYQLPESIHGWGGLTFDDHGAIISAEMPSVGSGPWYSLDESYRVRLRTAVNKEEENPYLKGWRFNGLRERVEDFIDFGLSKQLAELESSQERVIIHADFTYEFFRSFGPNGGRFTGWICDKNPEGEELAVLRMAKLTGQFPSPLPTLVVTVNGPGVDWELAQAWEDELREQNVKKPSAIRGIDKLADVDELLGALTPWRLINKDFLRMNTDEGQRMALRRMAEEQLVAVLDHMGF